VHQRFKNYAILFQKRLIISFCDFGLHQNLKVRSLHRKRGGVELTDELRFKIIKAMLDEFPQLREEVKKWLLEKDNPKIRDKTSSEK